VGAGVEPGVAAPHDLHIELAPVQVGLVDSGDFQLASGTGFDGLGDVDHLAVVKIQTGDGVAALRLERFFFNAVGLAVFIKGDDAVALGVLYMVGKDSGAKSWP